VRQCLWCEAPISKWDHPKKKYCCRQCQRSGYRYEAMCDPKMHTRNLELRRQRYSRTKVAKNRAEYLATKKQNGSRRQARIMDLVDRGMSMRQIGVLLGLSRSTVSGLKHRAQQ
jgi:DNA-binding NarL/FixJ family response regulator